MLGLALACARLSYDAVLIFQSPKSTWKIPYLAVTVFTDAEMIAGFYCESTGHHGETSFSQPFVASKGKFTFLPRGSAEYGRVFAGNDQILVGELIGPDYKSYPAKWTPDPVHGWARAKVNRVGDGYGYATAMTKNGTILVTSSKAVVAFGDANLAFKREKFDTVGVDDRNRVWGNAYGGVTFGGSRVEKSAAYMIGQEFVPVSKAFSINDVNAKGHLCGKCEPAADYGTKDYEKELAPVAFIDGVVKRIELPENRFSSATGINEKDQVVGYFNVGMDRAKPKDGKEFRNVGFLWENGLVTELPMPANDVDWFHPADINSSGAIVGCSTVEGRERVYLLRKR